MTNNLVYDASFVGVEDNDTLTIGNNHIDPKKPETALFISTKHDLGGDTSVALSISQIPAIIKALQELSALWGAPLDPKVVDDEDRNLLSLAVAHPDVFVRMEALVEWNKKQGEK